MAGGADIRAGKAFVEFYVKHASFTKGISAIQAQIRSVGAGLGTIGKGMMAAGLAIVAPILAATKSWAGAGDEMWRLSKTTGVAVEALSSLKFAANESSVETENLAKAFPKMAKFMQEAAQGGKEQIETLQQLGLRMADLAAMTPDEQFRAMAEAISRIQNPTLRMAAALKLFGKSGAELLPMFAAGRAGIEAYEEEARNLGLVTSGPAAQAAHVLNKSLGLIPKVIASISRSIGSVLAPYLQIMIDRIVKALPGLRAWINEHKGMVAGIAAGAAAFAAAGAGLFILGRAIAFTSVLLTPLKLLATALATALPAAFSVLATIIGGLLSPFGLVLIAVGILAYAFREDLAAAGSEAFSYLKDLAGKFAGDFQETWGGIADAIAAGDLALAAEVAWAGLKIVWARGVNEFKKLWEGAKWWLFTVWDEISTKIAAVMIEVVAAIEKAWEKAKKLGKEVVNVLRAAAGGEYEMEVEDLRAPGKGGRPLGAAAPYGAEAARAGARRALEEDKERRQRERDAAYGANLADQQKAVADATKALADVRGRAKTARTAAEAAKAKKGEEKQQGMEMPAEAAKSMTAGTFSGYALSLMGMGGSAADRTAAATERSREILKRIEDLLGKGMKTDVQFA
jgi:hypothetical protein